MALGGLHFRGADGCAIAPRLGEHVEISDETAIIVWEAEQQLEHFIRSATFETDAKDFGFLVPTPTQPTLHEVDQQAFSDLFRITAPRFVAGGGGRQREVGGCGCSSSEKVSATPGAAPPVRVLEETRVAGHDATVLEADDADSLAAWLKEHDYPSSPELTEWLQPYIAEKWKITAFKYVKEESPEPKLMSNAIRLTFKTEKPVYPYREPKAETSEDAATAATKARLLRVYFVADSRYQGELGPEAEPWPAQTAWAGKLQDFQVQQLSQRLKLTETDQSAAWWLTEFEDHSSPRPTTRDLYFSPAKVQESKERPPIHATHEPRRGDAAIYLATMGVIAVYAYGVRRRRT